ncbi:ABC transporter substrate-binding protein [Paraburkholderia sp. Ac-20336]|uniref:ABC transporter substrate-binding protein n=1 Tax=Burkholderiaceae TaxID=119060 RepID=UPI001420E6DE|nr:MULTISPECIES: ABC transporter substrate-binding protein [Burkholderiaceae]MBN3801732.1 ABC transporter substrate-binding protein [Paraburkholderia sp. Ac-20336]MBN3845614.1 ABC transporter substrate-binding protein [Paraburkholderia sp. Ac-20342]NIF51052.1 ABC transporter substrate-binding protein [Burkholderia sp. Ax-1724]
MKTTRLRAVLGAWLFAGASAAAHGGHYPVTVHSCNRDVTFTRAPTRAVSNDVNLTEMLLALGVRSHMAGYTGISGWKSADAAFAGELNGLPELAQRYPSLETLVAAQADLYVAGWNYGMRVGGPITPATLAPFGIATYELSESCGHVMPRPAASLDDVYNDLRNLGAIFDADAQAQSVIASMQTRIADVARALNGTHDRPRVFVYDSGEDKPFTAGKLAMPTALIRAAGGRNVMDDVAQSWAQVSWESVVARDPQVIVIVDYGAVTAAQKEAFLLASPALANVAAIRERRFIVVPYDAATPGVRNAEAIGTIARGLHPEAFARPPRVSR